MPLKSRFQIFNMYDYKIKHSSDETYLNLIS